MSSLPTGAATCARPEPFLKITVLGTLPGVSLPPVDKTPPDVPVVFPAPLMNPGSLIN